MDITDGSAREELAGDAGRDLVSSCTSEASFREALETLCEACSLEKQNDREVALLGLCRHICFLIHSSRKKCSVSFAKEMIDLCIKLLSPGMATEVSECMAMICKEEPQRSVGWCAPALVLSGRMHSPDMELFGEIFFRSEVVEKEEVELCDWILEGMGEEGMAVIARHATQQAHAEETVQTLVYILNALSEKEKGGIISGEMDALVSIGMRHMRISNGAVGGELLAVLALSCPGEGMRGVIEGVLREVRHAPYPEQRIGLYGVLHRIATALNEGGREMALGRKEGRKMRDVADALRRHVGNETEAEDHTATERSQAALDAWMALTGGGAAVKPGAVSVTGPMDVSVESSPKNMAQLEDDALLKCRSSSPEETKPGVISVSSNKISVPEFRKIQTDNIATARGRGRGSMIDMERDALVKARAAGTSGIIHMEEDTLVKARSTSETSSQAPSKLQDDETTAASSLSSPKHQTQSRETRRTRSKNHTAPPINIRPTPFKSDSKTWDSEKELAIAVAIEDDEYSQDYAHIFAQEYDPDYKPALYKNPRFLARITGCVICLLVSSVGVILTLTKRAVYVPDATEGPSMSPTLAPTSYRETLGIQSLLERNFDYNVTEEAFGEARMQAMEWIVNEDQEMLIVGDGERLIQRYILALLYFSTHGDEWTYCGYNPEIHNYDTNCTYDYYDQVGTLYSWNETAWLTDTHECSWFGVVCTRENIVREILLFDNHLQGTLPYEIAHFSFLRRFWVNANDMGGSIPTQFGEMKHLADLQLHGNEFTGKIPEELFEVLTLQALNLGFNQFTGTVSTRFGDLENLKGFFLLENLLSGTIPEEIGNLNYLAFVWVSNNHLSGTLPTSLGRLVKVMQLDVRSNLLNGTLPTEIGQMKELEALMLENNYFTGTLPDELYTLTKLQTLFLQSNKFSGTISSDVGDLVDLQKLLLKNNLFNGTIPEAIGSLTDLQAAFFHYNDFEGTVPELICDLRSQQQLEILYADCDDTMNNALVECSCCTDCCDAALEVCYSTF